MTSKKSRSPSSALWWLPVSILVQALFCIGCPASGFSAQFSQAVHQTSLEASSGSWRKMLDLPCMRSSYMSHHHHHHHADIYNAPITTKQEHRCSTKIQIVVDETYWTLKAILKKIGFELVLKNSTVWYGAQFCRKTVPCNWSSKREGTFSELGLQMWYGVAGGVWGGTQVRACYSCRRELQCIREITWSLPNMDVMHHSTKLVCESKLHWQPVQLN